MGHIEDIAVEKGQQGKRLGLRLIQALDYVAAQVGCYKVCLLLLIMGVVVVMMLMVNAEYSRLLRGE